MHIEDLPDDALKRILQCLSTDQRRTLSIVNKKWQRLIGESWTELALCVGGKNYLDSANKQIQWLLQLDLQQLQVMQLDFKGFELSGISVDYLIGPLLELLEQGRFGKLHTFEFAADMSLPDELVSETILHLTLDVYALTTYIRCPCLRHLKLTAVSMPGPTLFSKEALQTWRELETINVKFRTCYLDDAPASWFLEEGLYILHRLEQATIALPSKLRLQMSQAQLCDALKHLEVSCRSLVLSVQALTSLRKLQNVLLVCNGVCVIQHNKCSVGSDSVLPQASLNVVPCSTMVGTKIQSGQGPFVFAH